ncbi:MAG: polysaccharide deacetylase family protein [Candidatus Thiodiazotropha weberae]|nr:polysaccharide deacetylase family protein [Candidatus Thiodiazotropha lotti]MCG8010171.1 polysaccharide deacetylase family protein [Candidatus Thiodiazotropha lotti]MCG8021632.1 polysaccharide deacetylase family protein [Candidatus Thiodiazotropha lotti]MCW4208801.1 polysaccharide deacetylase family protein [Candidatus Thiodiazotropha lotti]MCW4209629.1 polysaccharide deacetylase family protein [Candidatus Thiodiazotropha lotti]
MKNAIKEAILNSYTYLNKNKTRIICYHRIAGNDQVEGISEKVFEQQLLDLSKQFNIIDMATFKKIQNGLIKLDFPLLITFDDGYEDNYSVAYKFLKKYNLPATIFLTTDFVDKKKWIWHDLYRYIVNNTKQKQYILQHNNIESVLDFSTNRSKLDARKIIHDLVKPLNKKDKITYLNSLAEDLGVEILETPTKEYSSMTWPQIKEMSENNICFGAHTCSHEILSSLEEMDIDAEIRVSKNTIEANIGEEVDTFAYPNGSSNDFNSKTVKAMRLNGIKYSFTMIPGINSKNDDSFTLRRYAAPINVLSNYRHYMSGIHNFQYDNTATDDD